MEEHPLVPLHRYWRFVAVVGIGLAAKPISAQVAEHPDWNVGDKWTYQLSSSSTGESKWSLQVMERVSQERYRARTGGGRDRDYDGEGNELDWRGPDYSWRSFNFPLSLGKRWNHERKIVDGSGNERSSSEVWEVKAYEKVTVPAGTFDCFRVEGKAQVNENGAAAGQSVNAGDFDITYWYCPEVKWVAKRQIRSRANETTPYVNEEALLASFTPAAAGPSTGPSTVLSRDTERPLWSVGDTWTYRRTVGPTTFNPAEMQYQRTFAVIELRANQYRADVTTVPVRGTGGEEVAKANWGITPGLNNYYRDSAELPYTEMKFLQWPLTVGKRWTFEYPIRDGRSFVWNVEVKRWEDVQVPAGRFRAVVVELEGQARGGDVYMERRTIWFAPDTKSRVKEISYGRWSAYTVSHVVEELESYKVQ